jgi:hypothetical protein
MSITLIIIYVPSQAYSALGVDPVCTSDSHFVCSLSSQVAQFLLAFSDYVPNLILSLLRNHHFHYHKYIVLIKVIISH